MDISLTYQRRKTTPVRIGGLYIGSDYPIRIQTMANIDTNAVDACVEQARRCIQAGAELVRFTTQGMREVASLAQIHAELMRRQQAEGGRCVPLVADVHFQADVAEAAARVVEKVRINPGNYIDPARKFRHIDYTDEAYQAELDRLQVRFSRLLSLCKTTHTALRLGVNHGSLSDRIMSRYGDTPAGMVESVMEFLRVAVSEDFGDIVISVKASNTRVMVETVRLLVQTMDREGMPFPLHLGVTEAGEGEDGRIKSAVGIGALLAAGIGDTLRVSLSEDPEREIPVARALADYFADPHSPRYSGQVHAAITDRTLVYTGSDTDWDLFCLHAAAECGHLLWDNACDSLTLHNPAFPTEALTRLSQDILQAARVCIYKTEYISCPGCGRTLFDLERTLARIKTAIQAIDDPVLRSIVQGLKIGVMGCIVNGPGEMADADYGYVGAGRGKVSLYKGKVCVRKNIPQEQAVPALLDLIQTDCLQTQSPQLV